MKKELYVLIEKKVLLGKKMLFYNSLEVYEVCLVLK